MNKDTTDALSPAALKILNCFRERGLHNGEMIKHWDFGDAVIWEAGFIRDAEVHHAWGTLGDNGYVIEYDAALKLTELGERFLYGDSATTPKVTSISAPTYEEMKARLAELESKQQDRNALRFKVSEKGGVSVYGLGRFPVTLYYEQWIRLLDSRQELRRFLDENTGKMKLRE